MPHSRREAERGSFRRACCKWFIPNGLPAVAGLRVGNGTKIAVSLSRAEPTRALVLP